MVSLETLFFSHYASYNTTVSVVEPVSVITPLLPPEMRLHVYFAPAAVTMAINFVTLTKKGNFKRTLNLLKDYPQIILSAGFTPFVFKWQTVYGINLPAAQQQNDNINDGANKGGLQVTVCERASFFNAMAIGCLPQAALIVSLLTRGAYTWDFFEYDSVPESFQFTTTLFPTENGAMIFSVSSLIFFSMLIVVFFKGHKMCCKCGLHCKFINVLFCPCPNPCLAIKPYHDHTKYFSSVMQLHDMNAIQAANPGVINEAVMQNEIYLYHGSKQIFLLNKPPQPQLAQPARNDEDARVRHCETHTFAVVVPTLLQHIKKQF